jgi:hypothetical protein
MYLSLRCSYAARALLVRCSCEARARFHLAWPIWRVLPAAELPYKDSGWNPQDRRREVEPRASQGARGSARLAIGSASVPKGRSGISHVLVFALLVRSSCEARARFHLAWPIWRVLPAAELPYKDSGWNPQDRRREVEPRASQGARGSARLAIGSASVPKGRSGISHVLVFALLVRCSCAARALLVRCSCAARARLVRGSTSHGLFGGFYPPPSCHIRTAGGTRRIGDARWNLAPAKVREAVHDPSVPSVDNPCGRKPAPHLCHLCHRWTTPGGRKPAPRFNLPSDTKASATSGPVQQLEPETHDAHQQRCVAPQQRHQEAGQASPEQPASGPIPPVPDSIGG